MLYSQGTEFDNLADTVLMDRFDRLVDLLTLTGEKGKLPIVMALASVVPAQQLVSCILQLLKHSYDLRASKGIGNHY